MIPVPAHEAPRRRDAPAGRGGPILDLAVCMILSVAVVSLLLLAL